MKSRPETWNCIADLKVRPERCNLPGGRGPGKRYCFRHEWIAYRERETRREATLAAMTPKEAAATKRKLEFLRKRKEAHGCIRRSAFTFVNMPEKYLGVIDPPEALDLMRRVLMHSSEELKGVTRELDAIEERLYGEDPQDVRYPVEADLRRYGVLPDGTRVTS